MFNGCSLCAGAEYLYQIVHGAIPIEPHTPAELAVHILNHLYHNLNHACLVQAAEVGTCFFLTPFSSSSSSFPYSCFISFSFFQQDSYRMLLYIFVACLLPYIEVLDSWIFEGILDDPFHEVSLPLQLLLPQLAYNCFLKV